MRKTLCLGFVMLATVCFSQESKFLEEGSSTIHYRTFGEGKPLLVINGGPGMNSNGFEDLAYQLSIDHKVIIYDQRGTGKSIIPQLSTQTITLDLMLSDIEKIREAEAIDKWTILGHSFGGMLACYYASNHPDRLNAMILSSSGGVDMELFNTINIRSNLSPNDYDSLNYWSNRISRGDTSYYARYNRGKHLAPAYLYNQIHVPRIAHRLTQSNMTVNGLVFQNMRAIDFDCKPQLIDFEKPVLIIQGDSDIIPTQISEKSRNLMVNSELIVLENCGHYGWLDRPDVFFEYIFDFLNTQKI